MPLPILKQTRYILRRATRATTEVTVINITEYPALRSCNLEIAAALSAACSGLIGRQRSGGVSSGVVGACVGASVEDKCGRCSSTSGLWEVAGRRISWRGGCKRGQRKTQTAGGDEVKQHSREKPNRPLFTVYVTKSVTRSL
jgi:hypothetical protein